MPDYSFKDAVESEEFPARLHTQIDELNKAALVIGKAISSFVSGVVEALQPILADPAVQRYMAARGYPITPRPYITTTRIVAHRPHVRKKAK